MYRMSLVLSLLIVFVQNGFCRYDVWNEVYCDEYYIPENCDYSDVELVTVDDIDRCGPAFLPLDARNYFLAAAGRRITYMDNKDAFDHIKILPKYLSGNSNNSLKTSVLGQDVDFPIGLSPISFQFKAVNGGELHTVVGLGSFQTVMIVGMVTTRLLEDVPKMIEREGYPHLWLQMYLHRNKDITLDLVRRAENSGYRALVVTIDAPIHSFLTCGSRRHVVSPNEIITNTNLTFEDQMDQLNSYSTMEDIGWLVNNTRLPVVVKGILSGTAAVEALSEGAAAILVSNHGGRQLDGVPATIGALPGVVKAVREFDPSKEVYMDGGVRSGHDVYKAIALGARMVFVGRPQIWGLAMGGSEGVKIVMEKLRDHFNETMIIAGYSRPSEIEEDSIILK